MTIATAAAINGKRLRGATFDVGAAAAAKPPDEAAAAAAVDVAVLPLPVALW